MRATRNSQPSFPAERLTRAMAKPVTDDTPIGDPLQQSINDTLGDLRDAVEIIETLKNSIRALAADVTEALTEEAIGRRALMAESYDAARLDLTRECDACPALLTPESEVISLSLRGGSNYTITPAPLLLGQGALSVPPANGGFADAEEIDTVLSALDRSLRHLDQIIVRFERDQRFLTRRITPPNSQT